MRVGNQSGAGSNSIWGQIKFFIPDGRLLPSERVRTTWPSGFIHVMTGIGTPALAARGRWESVFTWINDLLLLSPAGPRRNGKTPAENFGTDAALTRLESETRPHAQTDLLCGLPQPVSFTDKDAAAKRRICITELKMVGVWSRKEMAEGKWQPVSPTDRRSS